MVGAVKLVLVGILVSFRGIAMRQTILSVILVIIGVTGTGSVIWLNLTPRGKAMMIEMVPSCIIYIICVIIIAIGINICSRERKT